MLCLNRNYDSWIVNESEQFGMIRCYTKFWRLNKKVKNLTIKSLESIIWQGSRYCKS